jgi:hypothetical protein
MGFFAGLLVCFSACMTVEGLMPRLLCLLLSLPCALAGWKAPPWLGPLFAFSFFLRAVALGNALGIEGREVLLALSLVSAVALGFLGRERLSRSFLPCGLVLLPFLGFCMAGKWVLPPAVMACPPREMLLALVCPVSGAFLTPQVKQRWWTAAGALAGGIFGVLLVFADFPVWEGTAVLAGCLLPMAMEAGMLFRKSAYTWGRRDANGDSKRVAAGDRKNK